MTSEEIDFDSIPKDSEYFEMLGGLKDDRFPISDIEEYLKSKTVKLYKLTVKGEYVGFFSVEWDGMPEAHAYILPKARRHSMSALRYMERSIPKPVLTSVYGTHKHVYAILKRMGFMDVGIREGVYHKNGKQYDIYFLMKRNF